MQHKFGCPCSGKRTNELAVGQIARHSLPTSPPYRQHPAARCWCGYVRNRSADTGRGRTGGQCSGSGKPAIVGSRLGPVRILPILQSCRRQGDPTNRRRTRTKYSGISKTNARSKSRQPGKGAAPSRPHPRTKEPDKGGPATMTGILVFLGYVAAFVLGWFCKALFDFE